MRRSFVNDSFVDDGDIKLVTNRFDKNTYCTVSGVGFVYCFIYLFIFWPLNSKDFQLLTTKYIKRYFAWDVGFRVLKL